MTAELARTLLLISIAACGLIAIVLSLMPWVEFTPEVNAGVPELRQDPIFSLGGTELSRIRGPMTIEETTDQASDACSCRSDFGDGYLVAILGGVMIAGAGGAVSLQKAMRSLTIVAILAAVGAFAIAGYNAIAIWEGVGRSVQTEQLMNLDGSVQAALYTLVAIAGLAAVLGGAALATTVQTMPEAPASDDRLLDDEDTVAMDEANET